MMREPKEYTDQLTEQLETAKTETVEAEKSLVLIKNIKITNAAFFEEVAGIVRMASGKVKFLDDERKISVTPLNHEVARINAWYKPALDTLQAIVDHGKSLMASYTIQQQRRERELLAQAQAEAQKALAAKAVEVANVAANAVAGVTAGMLGATASEVGAAANTAANASAAATALVKQAATEGAPPPKVAGVSAPKPAWKFTITDAAALLKAHPDFAMVDEKKVKAWVAANGDTKALPGLKVEPDVKFNIRS